MTKVVLNMNSDKYATEDRTKKVLIRSTLLSK